MKFAYIQAVSVMILGLSFYGCGGSESTATAPEPVIIANGNTLYLHAFSPLVYGIDTANPTSTQLVPVANQLELIEYQAIVEASLDSTKTQATSLVTGIGIDVVDGTGNALNTLLLVWAREFDPKTGYFSGIDRVFSNQAGVTNAVGAQKFVLLNSNSPNYVLTGIGLRMKNATVSKLFLQRKSIGAIAGQGDPMNGGTRVELPAGWGAIGFALKVTKPSGPAAYIDRALISTAWLRSQ